MRDQDVALLGCDSYDRGLVEEKVEQAFDLLGGPGAVANEGESVFVKVNALGPMHPEKAVTTHPEVVRAVINQLKKMTPDITVGDSHVGPSNKTRLRQVYRKTGLAQVAEETGVSLHYGTSSALTACPAGKTMKDLSLCREMVEADRLVSVSKFKTHLLMNISGAIKNVYGAVPGMTKFTYHAMFQDQEQFADLLVDVLLAAAPDFHIVDAVVGMEGNGPRQGDARKIGVIAASKNPFALETLMTHLVGMDTRINVALKAAVDRGFCSGDMSHINVLGGDPREFGVDGFRLPTDRSIIAYLPAFFMRIYGRRMSLRPHPDPARCTGCGRCAEICPVKAISMNDGIAVVDTGKCIKCYCCDETCEYDAVDLKRPLLMRLVRLGR